MKGEVKSSREPGHSMEGPPVTSSGFIGPVSSSVLLGLEGSSGSSRKPLSPSDTSIDESVKSAQHAGKEVSVTNTVNAP